MARYRTHLGLADTCARRPGSAVALRVCRRPTRPSMSGKPFVEPHPLADGFIAPADRGAADVVKRSWPAIRIKTDRDEQPMRPRGGPPPELAGPTDGTPQALAGRVRSPRRGAARPLASSAVRFSPTSQVRTRTLSPAARTSSPFFASDERAQEQSLNYTCWDQTAKGSAGHGSPRSPSQHLPLSVIG
jgi:hypothetical protein